MQRITLFNIQFFVSIVGFIGATSWYIYFVLSGGHDEWGILFFITITLDVLFTVLGLVYKKLRYRTYKEGGPFIKIFWVISLLWLVFLTTFTAQHIQLEIQDARFAKEAEQRLVYCTNVLVQQGISDRYSPEGELVMEECYLYYKMMDDYVPVISNIDKNIVSVGEELVITGENLVPTTNSNPHSFGRRRYIDRTLTITNSSGLTAYVHNSVAGNYTYTNTPGMQYPTEHAEPHVGKKMTSELLDSYCMSRIIEEKGHNCPGHLKITPGRYTLQIKYWGGLESNEVGIVVK